MPLGGRVKTMNMKTLALVTLVLVALAATPVATATPVDSHQLDNGCSISGFVTTSPPGFNLTVVGDVVSCIIST